VSTLKNTSDTAFRKVWGQEDIPDTSDIHELGEGSQLVRHENLQHVKRASQLLSQSPRRSGYGLRIEHVWTGRKEHQSTQQEDRKQLRYQ
jgi:hypothetical protein